MKALFVDDDVEYSGIFVKCMNEYCKSLNIKINCDVCNDLKKVLDRVSNYDIYFLDIEMGETNGLNLAEEIRAQFKEKEIVFVSFYESYVFQTFKVKPFAFIRKNNLETDLYDALTNIKQRIYEKYSLITIRINSKNSLKLSAMDLMYCQSEGHYVQFVFKSGKSQTIRMKLSQVKEAIEHYGFIRVHVSYLINEAYIDSVHANELILVTGQSIQISRSYKRKVYSQIFDKEGIKND